MIPFSIWSYVKPCPAKITIQQKQKRIAHDSHGLFADHYKTRSFVLENLIYTKASGLVILREVRGYVRF